MFHRPLILLLISYAGGVLLAQAFPAFITSLYIARFSSCLISSLLAVLFCSYRVKIYFLLFACFSGAVLLTARENLPDRLESLARDYRKITIEGIVLTPVKIPREGMARVEVLAIGRIQNKVFFLLSTTS